MRIAVIFIFLGSICEKSLSQNIDAQAFLINGLTLSFYLGNEEFEKIEDFLKKSGHRYDAVSSKEGLLPYNKTWDTGFSIIVIDTQDKEHLKIIYSVMKYDDPFFRDKILRELKKRDEVFIYSEESETFVFFVLGEEEKLLYGSSIYWTEGRLIFFAPVECNPAISWDEEIPKLIKN